MDIPLSFIDKMKADGPIVVIGAGIIGSSTAWALAKHNFRVVLLDQRKGPFKGISSAGFGSLTPFSDPFYRGEARDFAAKAVDIYRKWVPELSNLSKSKITFSDLGLLQLCQNGVDVAKAKKLARSLNRSGYKAEMLNVKDTRKLEPNLKGRFNASLWMDEPWLDRDQYFSALRHSLSASQLITQRYGTTAKSVVTANKKLAVYTTSGGCIKCSGVVVSNGLHTDQIAGIPSFPLKWVRGDAIEMHTTNGKPLLQRHIYLHSGFLTPRAGSEMLLGATYDVEHLPSANARQHPERIALAQFFQLIKANLSILPALSKCEISRVWRNWRPKTPDKIPILGPLARNPHVIAANGFIGLGLTLAPAVAESIADYFIQLDATVFPTSFSPQRPFSRHTRRK